MISDDDRKMIMGDILSAYSVLAESKDDFRRQLGAVALWLDELADSLEGAGVITPGDRVRLRQHYDQWQ